MAAVEQTQASDDLTWALRALRDQNRLSGYRIAESYYDGAHRLAFATEKFRTVFGRLFSALADNLCPAVVDSVTDRLKVTGFSSETDQSLADEAWTIWQRNRMDIRGPETHHEALLMGDGHALVWPDKTGRAVIWSIPAHEVAVAYDRNQPGVIRRAGRLWQDIDGDFRWHLDLYYPDRVERWISRQAPKSASLFPQSYNARSFEPWWGGCDEWSAWSDTSNLGGGLAGAASVQNPVGQVPLIHFPNRRYHTYGISELANVVPLQDALNKAVCDMLVAMEFSAFRQRWATGIEVGEVDDEGKPVEPPFDPGVDRIFAVENENARFGDFSSTDLTQYVEVQENLRSEIARVSGTPLHYLFITRGDFPSGEAMKSAEARFTRKVEQRQTSFGNQWENLMALAVKIERNSSDAVEPSELSTEWESASPLSIDTGQPTPTTISATEKL